MLAINNDVHEITEIKKSTNLVSGKIHTQHYYRAQVYPHTSLHENLNFVHFVFKIVTALYQCYDY